MNSLRVRTGRRTAGTTLVEVLVVMVIFLLGMLAMVQVFPGGLKILRQNRDQTVATALGRGESDRLTGRVENLPDMIVPVSTFINGLGQIGYSVDILRRPNSLGPVSTAATLNENGHFLDADGNDIGLWPYVSGVNVTRRVIGEGGIIPAPRAVGAEVGSLLILQFAPIVFSADYEAFFEVYGNELAQRHGEPAGRPRPYIYYLENWDDATASIHLPRSTTKTLRYRVSLSAWVTETSFRRTDVVTTTPIEVPPDPDGGFLEVDLQPLVTSGTLHSVDPQSFHVSRLFDRITGAFSGDPYEYKLLDDTLGLVLFNPAGYNYKVRTGGGRSVPLTGKVNYDVYDWRILREDFRVPEVDHPMFQLALGNLAVPGSLGPDGKQNPGFPIPAGSGTYANGEFALMDMDTGGIFLRSSMKIDGSKGVVHFVDRDTATNGIQMELLLPGAASPVTVTATGRSVRALYRASGEWAVQVTKPAATYRAAWSPTGSMAMFYPGGWNADLADPGRPTRAYFPWIDLGCKVTVREIHYFDTSGNARVLEGQDFIIRTAALEQIPFPFIDILDVVPDADRFDFSYGPGLIDVQGASVKVRVVWNPEFFSLGSDTDQNLRAFNVWQNGWRRNETETFLKRSEN